MDMSDKKQTAVEWLFERINMFCMFTDGIPDEWSEALEQAKAMEKQQIIDACNQEEFEDIDGYGIHETISKGEQYYNQTYGGNNGK